MNRPKRVYAPGGDYKVYTEVYTKHLEDYCDNLESKLELAIGTAIMLDERLDKACEELARLDYENWLRQYPFVHDYDHKDVDHWKEWLMSDD